MRIIELRAENFKRLRAVDIRPDDALVQVTGRNGQGKTSTLDAIWVALKGKAAGVVEPIRRGQERCTLKLSLGELTVVRTFTRQDDGAITTNLTVTAADGSRISKSPQAALDALIGELAFDPLAFNRMAAKDQYDSLRRLVKGFDFEANAEKRKRAFEDRTALNRQAREQQVLADGIVLPPGNVPKPIDIAAKVEALETAVENNAALIQRANEIEGHRRGIADIERQMTVLQERKDALQKLLDVAGELPEPVDTSALSAEIASAAAVNKVVERAKQRRHHENEAERFEVMAAGQTNLIEALDREKAAAIEAAKLPVEGLGFGDDVVLLNGVPFSQAGTAEKLRTSIALAMAMNPTLRIIRCDEGSELDSEQLAVVRKMAQDENYQIWLARVDQTGKVGFVIEDGRLAQAEAAE